MSITHTKVSAIPDGVDTALVRPSDWNADHTVTSPLIVATVSGGVATTSTLRLQPTTGVGATGSAVVFGLGNNGATEAGRFGIHGPSGLPVLWLGGTTADTGYALIQSGNNLFINAASEVGITILDGSALFSVRADGITIGGPANGPLGAGTLNVENEVRTGPLTATGSASAYPLVLDNTATASRSWRVGPSTSGTGNFVVFRAPDNVGVYVAYGDTAWTAGSDARLKQDVQTLDDGLSVITRLRPVAFRWKDRRSSPAPQIGFLAQEVQAVAPLAVRVGEPVTVEVSDTETLAIADALGVTETKLIPYLVSAVQTQQGQIEALTQAVAALQAGSPGS